MSESAQESPLDPDEPSTPAWFTFLGVGLFLLAGIFLLATGGDDEPSAGVPAAAEAPSEGEAAGEAPAANAEAPVDPHAGHNH